MSHSRLKTGKYTRLELIAQCREKHVSYKLPKGSTEKHKELMIRRLREHEEKNLVMKRPSATVAAQDPSDGSPRKRLTGKQPFSTPLPAGEDIAIIVPFAEVQPLPAQLPAPHPVGEDLSLLAPFPGEDSASIVPGSIVPADEVQPLPAQLLAPHTAGEDLSLLAPLSGEDSAPIVPSDEDSDSVGKKKESDSMSDKGKSPMTTPGKSKDPWDWVPRYDLFDEFGDGLRVPKRRRQVVADRLELHRDIDGGRWVRVRSHATASCVSHELSQCESPGKLVYVGVPDVHDNFGSIVRMLYERGYQFYFFEKGGMLEDEITPKGEVVYYRDC